jgi:hypothetical protein
VSGIESRRWRRRQARPGRWLLLSSAGDVTLIVSLAVSGVLMGALPLAVVAGLFGAAAAFIFVLDTLKVALFQRLNIA